MLRAALVEGHHLPHLGQKCARQFAVLVEQLVEPIHHVADGCTAGFDPLGDQRPQSETSGVITHPAGLEGGVLTVIGEDQQPRAFR